MAAAKVRVPSVGSSPRAEDRADDVIVVGAGIFGLTAALELQKRGLQTRVVDPGPIPHPLASSTDISKLLRGDYGKDEFYTRLMEESFVGWRAWNARFKKELGEELFHQTGILVLRRGPMTEGFEYDTFNTLRARGYPLERLDSDALRARFPAWHCGTYKEGYVNPQAGWVESGRVVAQVAKWCREAGVRFTMERVVRILDGQGRVQGVTTETGATLRARRVVVAAGAWNCDLVPQTREIMHPTAQVVLHFRVPAHLVPLFTPPLFPGYAADIGRTGFYGFPVHPERLPGGDGVLKVGCHAEGVKFFGVSDEKIAELLDRLWQPALERARRFLRDSLPSVADAPLIFKRVCLYTDTYDTDFLIDAVPSCAGLFIAGGGSGHAFKFAPMLGRVIADLACGEANEFLTRFRWRSPQSVHVERDRGDAARISTFKDAAIAARL